MESATQNRGLSKELETYEFDQQTGQTWIYPTNYPMREYQFNIIQAALFNNTLVSLPTGLGKTFIAAVVMYNFYRWYPHGKIIFMAPTRPLVKQQIEACYSIMAIPEDVTAELTGTKISTSRSSIWLGKRVFFVTPQVLQNDLENVAQLGEKIKCLVFDEAHKAKGNHAYCQVIRKLTGAGHKYFRVLALSATPGCNVNDVTEVAQNLLISHLEFRTEESKDVEKYVFQRSLETVVVHLDDKLIEIRNEYMQVIEYYARTLIKYKIIQGNCGSLTKGKIFMLMKEFQNKNRGSSSSNYSEIMKCLNICVTLYHALELLIRHGLRNFLSFFDEHIEKPLLKGNGNLRSIMENVRAFLGPLPHIAVLPDGTYPEIPNNIKFGHPKHYKLRDILINHFASDDKKNTRVIVFFEYRESVMEAHTLLLQSRPMIQPKVFIGQGSGVTQKTQLGVVKAFKEGKCNTLLSTCIGEEGLDVGEVDLIICFDISNKSPIRMVQRMGRTGRKRAGSVLVLVTEGKEQQTLKDCLMHKNNISTHVLSSAHLKNSLYPDSPRLVPDHLNPRCEKLFIAPRERNQKNLIIEKLKKHASKGIIFSQEDPTFNVQDFIPKTRMMSLERNPMKEGDKNYIFFNKHSEKMRTLQKVSLVKHSPHATLLSELLMYADSKRFNIPIKTLGKTEGLNEKALKQGDIRHMFFAGKRVDEIEFTQQSQLSQPQKESTFSAAIEEALKILPDYLGAEFPLGDLQCPYCPKGFDCADFDLKPSKKPTGSILIPSHNVVNQITLEAIENFIASIDQRFYRELYDEMLDDPSFTQCQNFYEKANKSRNAGQSFFEPPSNFCDVLEKINVASRGSQESDYLPLNKTIKEETLLEFFKLKALEDLFKEVSFESSQNTIIYSPTNFEDTPEKSSDSKETRSPTMEELMNIGQICDLSYFGLLEPTEGIASSLVSNVHKTKITQVQQQQTNDCIGNSNDSKVRSPLTSLRNALRASPSNSTSKHGTPPKTKEVRDSNDSKLDETFVAEQVINCTPINSPSKVQTFIEIENNSPVLSRALSRQTPSNQSRRSIKFDGPMDETFVEKNFNSSTYSNTWNLKCPVESLNFNLSSAGSKGSLPNKSSRELLKGKMSLSLSSPRLEKVALPEESYDGLWSPKSTKETMFLDQSTNSPKLKCAAQITNLNSPTVSKLSQDTVSNLNSSNNITGRKPATQIFSIVNSPSVSTVAQVKHTSGGVWKSKNNADETLVSPKQSLNNKKRRQAARRPTWITSVDDSSDDAFEDISVNEQGQLVRKSISPTISSYASKARKRKTLVGKAKKTRNEFLDTQASVSNNESLRDSDDENEDGLDVYDQSFVHDVTLNVDTQMHALYLRSIRSPAIRKGVQRNRPVTDTLNVYSQLPINETNEYVNDSFCVESVEEDSAEENQLTQLTALERQLEEKKRRKKLSESERQPKRRRIKVIFSDDSD